ncbi:MAG: serine acetyltransferase [Ruminococcaceae bacterium]|nr:serine acetyltransferase [Oscillospiraceae bacterium]
MYDQHIQDTAARLAESMADASTRIYGKRLHLPDRKAIIAILNDLRKLFFPAYFGDAGLMALAPEDYAALLLEPIETLLAGQIALALPDGADAAALAREFVEQLPQVHRLLMTDVEALFDGDPAAQNREEVIFSYPGLYAIFVYRVAHELYLRRVPIIPRIMSEYAHSRTGIDIHPGASIGAWFFIDHGTGVVVGETTVIGDHVKLYQGVTLGALSPRAGHASLPGKRHPTVEDNVTIYSGASILGGSTVIGHDSVVGGNAFLTRSVPAGTRVVIQAPEATFKNPNDPFIYNI